MIEEIQVKEQVAQFTVVTLEILNHSMRIIDGVELAPRTSMAEIVRRISRYGDFPALRGLAGAPESESVMLAVEGMSVLERVIELLADPRLDDSETVRALVKFLRGYGFGGLNDLRLPKSGMRG